MRVLEGYAGGNSLVDEQLARLYNKCRSDEPWSQRAMEPRDIAELFRSTWFSPGMLALLELGRRVVGYSWVWRSRGGPESSLCIDPGIPEGLRRIGVEILLSWIGRRCREKGGGRLFIWAGLRYGYTHRVIRDALTGFVEERGSTLMRFSGRIREVEPPRGYEIVRVENPVDERVLRGVVEVYNEAFSRYEWHFPRSYDDVHREFARRRPVIFAALKEGEIVGFAELTRFRAVDGGVSVEVAVLAVRPRHQGRGLGKALLHRAVLYAVEVMAVVDRLFLVSVPGLEGFYFSMGFVPWRESVGIKIPVGALPLRGYPAAPAQG